MNTALWSLFVYTVWAFFLLLPIAAQRISSVFAGKAKPMDFPADQPHGSPLYRRMMRAHLNAIENLPIFASLILIATIVQIQTEVFVWLSVVCVSARILHSLIHMCACNNNLVIVRATAYYVQYFCYLGLSWQIFKGATQSGL